MRIDSAVRMVVGRGKTTARAGRLALMLAMTFMTLLSACSMNKKQDEGAEPVPPTRLRVENQAFLDMTIYVYRSSQRIRLGVASGNSTSRMTIPQNLIFGATPLRFQADPIGGNRTPISQEITVSAGDEVTITIPPN